MQAPKTLPDTGTILPATGEKPNIFSVSFSVQYNYCKWCLQIMWYYDLLSISTMWVSVTIT